MLSKSYISLYAVVLLFFTSFSFASDNILVDLKSEGGDGGSDGSTPGVVTEHGTANTFQAPRRIDNSQAENQGYQKHINRLEGYLERKGALDERTLAIYKAGGCDSEPRSCSANIRSPIDKQTFDTLIGLRKKQAKRQRLNKNPVREGTTRSVSSPPRQINPPKNSQGGGSGGEVNQSTATK